MESEMLGEVGSLARKNNAVFCTCINCKLVGLLHCTTNSNPLSILVVHRFRRIRPPPLDQFILENQSISRTDFCTVDPVSAH